MALIWKRAQLDTLVEEDSADDLDTIESGIDVEEDEATVAIL